MPASSSPLIAQDVHRTYVLGGHELRVLRGVELEVAAGEKVFLCGQSGAGKTTLLYVLGGLEKPTRGDVLVHGKSLYHGPAAARARARNQTMGFVFQHYFLLPELTALENVLLPAMIGGRKAGDRARELLDRVGLAGRMDHLPTELSGGEQQRVAVARALFNSPSVVLADEPSGNLDSAHARELHQLFFDLRKELGQTFVIVTHNEELADMADRKLVMKDGVI
ncbi:MAG TPA: ABC transporter [Verrucomicrobiales bacterium]|nr:ABC transporter [Verrucomicrobiales bacterium]